MTGLRIGHGYDVHRLTEGRRLILGGVEVPYEKGLLGHSDADVLTRSYARPMAFASRSRWSWAARQDRNPCCARRWRQEPTRSCLLSRTERVRS